MNNDPISVCIVEDNAAIRESLVQLIGLAPDINCTGSFDAAEPALLTIPKLQPDIVLMDIDLPGLNGIECIKQLKPLCPETQFMVCTVYDEDQKVFDALTAGANGYMLKRNSEKLPEAIHELKAGGSPMSSDIARKVVLYFQKKEPAINEYDLTAREIEILKLLARGYTYQQSADQLYISPKTIKKHVYNIYEKLHVNSRTGAVNKFFGQGS
ncbi:MAG: response regulator transcription factor [Dinghuibacter sp.]|nr:response regulator transcription factor [Dinghuibacter sp.]